MRNRIIISFPLILLISISAAAKVQDKQNLSREIPADYYIEAELDTSIGTLTGSQRIRFLNPTDKELSFIAFHLYPNAFRDTLTTMARSNAGVKKNILENPSALECESIQVDGDSPDSVFLDETLLYIFLRDGLKPNKKLDISLEFKLMIPRVVLRMGVDAYGNYLFSHWYPTLVGYQKNKPMLYQYGDDGEFFSNFANYEVNITIPEGFLLVSTAGSGSPDSTASGKSYYSLAASRVIDFAFACGPAWSNDSYFYKKTAIKILTVLKIF